MYGQIASILMNITSQTGYLTIKLTKLHKIIKTHHYFEEYDQGTFHSVNIQLSKLQHLELSHIVFKDVALFLNSINEHCYNLETLNILRCRFNHDRKVEIEDDQDDHEFVNRFNFEKNHFCLFLPNVKSLKITKYQFKSLLIDGHKLEDVKLNFEEQMRSKQLHFVDKVWAKKKPFRRYRYKYMQHIGVENYKKVMMKCKGTKFKLTVSHSNLIKKMKRHPRVSSVVYEK